MSLLLGLVVGAAEVKDLMPGFGWRVRMFARRAVPHTPAKRWGYGAAVGVVVLTLITGHPLVAALTLVAGLVVRGFDLERSSSRRGRLPTNHAYFFEGNDDQAAPGRRRER